MKKNLLFLALIFGALLTSCKKDDETSPETPTTPTTPALTYLISKDSAYSSTITEKVCKYQYNSNKKLVKVSRKFGTSTSYTEYDTIIYNTNGTISTYGTIDAGGVRVQGVFFYTGTVLDSVIEAGYEYDYNTSNWVAFDRTHLYGYTSGKVTSVSVVYYNGSNVNGNPENINSITYSGNNISSANVVDGGIGTVALTSETTAPNPYYGHLYDINEILNMCNQNNVLTVTNTTTLDVYENKNYDYSSGRVSQINDVANSSTTVITYVGL